MIDLIYILWSIKYLKFIKVKSMAYQLLMYAYACASAASLLTDTENLKKMKGEAGWMVKWRII